MLWQISIAQHNVFAIHYDTEDGLPQKTVMDIIQDQHGFMWFSTWDGICKFDGVNFYPYKVRKEDSHSMRSDRFDGMWLDQHGYIWVNTYEGEMYRFDPRIERFRGLRSLNQFSKINFTTHGVTSNPSGKIWLLSPKLGCICFKDTTYTPVFFSKSTHLISNNHVNSVFEDSNGDSWLLSNGGIYVFSPQLKSKPHYFAGQPEAAKAFYRAIQIGNDIWLGADSGKVYRYNLHQKHFQVLKTGAKAPVKYVKPINSAQTFLATADDAFFILDNKTGQLQPYSISNLRPGARTQIINYYIDRTDNIWLQTDETGVSRFSVRTRQFKYFKLQTPTGPRDLFAPRFYVWEDSNNRLWLQPGDAGLHLYDPATDELKPFRVPAFNYRSQSSLLHAGYSDKQGNLWLSTRSNGVNKISFSTSGFKTDMVDPDTSKLSNNEVRSIMQDHRGRLWVGTKGGKVLVYDATHRQLGYVCKDGSIGHGEPIDGMTYTMTEDATHRIWIGTKGKGVYRLLPNADSTTFRISHYQKNDANPYSLSDDRVYSIYVDINNRVWVGVYGGGINLLDDKTEGRFYNYKNKMTDYPMATAYRVRAIGGDKYGNLYVGTPLGLFVSHPRYDDVAHLHFEHFERSPGQGSIAGNDIYDIHTTKKGETYIACFGGGLNKVSARKTNGMPASFVTYTADNGLASNLIQQIEEDNHGNLWLSTESSVSKLDPRTQLFESYYDVSRLLRGEILSEGGATHTSDGHILFGYTGGMISIDPTKLALIPFTPYVALTAFRIANQDVLISDSTVLSKNIDYLQHVKLNHKQNFISVEFAALDFKNTQQLNYAYRLDGIDNNWVYTKQGEASYSNLSPGRYVFRVKSTNSYGIWANNEHHIVIEITPAIWQTGWAWAFYVIAATVLIFLSLRWVYQYFRLKDRLQLEHEQAEMKTNFFTDISHEIRTPLTMIVSPLEHMLQAESFEPKVKDNLQLIYKNATRMLRLVNQVLDLRKMESQLLIVREVNAGELVTEVATSFAQTATMKGIDLQVDNRAQQATVWLDKEGFEKIIYNLLSNAMKHTTVGDTVKIEVFLQHAELVMRVSDSGHGMNSELLQKLFSRFISYNPNKSQPSTGIGLSIVKEIVERHHARINVESTEFIGSTFTIHFQCGNVHFKDDPNVVLLKGDAPVAAFETEQLLPTDEPGSTENGQNTILVIEDDDDLRKYITGILQPAYQVIEATNGEEGMQKATAETPDFILSDIMMPGTDGLSFLKQLRSNPATSHIPLVFLTAHADQETELQAYNYGAEAFMTKPFSTRVLQSRIKTILDQRKRLYQSLAASRADEPAQSPEVSALASAAEKAPKLSRLDEQFIKKIRSEIEKHIADNDYTVEELISIMPMSRTVFVKKLKSLTGQSPVEFMRFVRIQYAARLLDSENYTIKEVSHMIGIADTKYFAQRFKEVIGMMPSEYKARGKS